MINDLFKGRHVRVVGGSSGAGIGAAFHAQGAVVMVSGAAEVERALAGW